MDDTKIIDLFWDRNEQAVKETDTAYGRKLYVLSNNILNNREDAEESVSDTYMKAWKTIPPKGLGHTPQADSQPDDAGQTVCKHALG